MKIKYLTHEINIDDWNIKNIINNKKIIVFFNCNLDFKYNILKFFKEYWFFNVELWKYNISYNNSSLLFIWLENYSNDLIWINNDIFIINNKIKTNINISKSNTIFLFWTKEYINTNILTNLYNVEINEFNLNLLMEKIIFNFYNKRNNKLSSINNWNNNRLDLSIWKICLNDCVFCNEWWKSVIKKSNTLDYNKDIIRKQKINWVMLWEREPTLSPEFIDNIKMCKTEWVNTISVITSWYNFTNIDFCEESLLNWLNEIRISLHWSNNIIHDKITWNNWSFERIIKSIYNFSLLSHKYNFDFVILVVICKYNMNDLLNIYKLVKDFWISRLSFSFVEIIESAEKNKDFIIPKISDLNTEINTLIEFDKNIYNDEKFSLNFENIPLFVNSKLFWKYLWKRSINFWDTPKWFIDNQFRKKEYIINCKYCSQKYNCEWINSWYKELYWINEFLPLPIVKDITKSINNVDKILNLLEVKDLEKLKKILLINIKLWFKKFIINNDFAKNKSFIIIREKFDIIYYNDFFIKWIN